MVELSVDHVSSLLGADRAPLPSIFYRRFIIGVKYILKSLCDPGVPFPLDYDRLILSHPYRAYKVAILK